MWYSLDLVDEVIQVENAINTLTDAPNQEADEVHEHEPFGPFPLVAGIVII